MPAETFPITLSISKEVKEWLDSKKEEGFSLSRLVTKMIEKAIEEERSKS